MTKQMMQAGEAASKLRENTQLNQLQIRKIVGSADAVSAQLIAAIIKIAGHSEQDLDTSMPPVVRRIPRLSSNNNRRSGSNRLSIPAALSLIERFTETEAL